MIERFEQLYIRAFARKKLITNNQSRFTIMSRDYPSSPQIAVGAVVFKEDKVLLVRRSQPPGKGLWAIPGGSLELGETLQGAAEREVKEETGISIRAKAPCYTFDVIERDDQDRIQFHYVIVDMAADYICGDPVAGNDASDARWVALSQLDTLPLSKHTEALLMQHKKSGHGDNENGR